MMNWVEIILVIHVVQLNLFLASEICPPSQYLNSSGVCVDCTQCHDLKHIIIRPCSSHADSVCGTIADLKSSISGFDKPSKSKKAKAESVKLNTSKITPAKTVSKSPVIVKQAKDDSYDEYSYDYELSTEKPVKKPANKTPKTKKNKSKNKSELAEVFNDPADLTISKLRGNKNGKHIKKDLSREGGSASIEYAVKPKVVDVTKNSVSLKAKSKFKDSSDHSVSIDNTKFVFNGNEVDPVTIRDSQRLHFLHPHVENHQIYVDVEPESGLQKKTKKSDQTQFYLGDASKVPRNETRVSAVAGSNETDLIGDEYDELDSKNDGDDSEENDVDEDDDDDDEDDDEDEDEDDDDDDDDEDEDEDTDEDEDYSLNGGKTNSKYPRFGFENVAHKNDEVEKFDEDEEYDVNDDISPKNVIYATMESRESDVNMEPFSSSGNWQLLILVSAISACLLFFIVVNAYVFIYVKKWKHMKQDFEADVEDLSVRINLMQHAGFEADETSNMKNYITQLRGGKSGSDKLPKTSLQA